MTIMELKTWSHQLAKWP